uniref:Uncharacterized protein n=1 Tax=Oryza rufipogon TaxID=4529 RepID=A0A0E0RDQ5_ORYRU
MVGEGRETVHARLGAESAEASQAPPPSPLCRPIPAAPPRRRSPLFRACSPPLSPLSRSSAAGPPSAEIDFEGDGDESHLTDGGNGGEEQKRYEAPDAPSFFLGIDSDSDGDKERRREEQRRSYEAPNVPSFSLGINSDGGDPELPLARCHTRPPLAAANADAPQPRSPTTADAPRSPLARPFAPPVPRAVARPPPPRLPAAPPASGREPLPLPIRGKENGD